MHYAPCAASRRPRAICVALLAPALLSFTLAACADEPTTGPGAATASSAASTDGGQPRIAFNASTSNGRHIYAINPDGSRLTRLTRGSSLNHAAAWSPDRRRIAFVSNRSGRSEIHVMDANGKNVRQLTNFASSGASVGTPSWSPDGTKIVFVATNPATGDIYVMDADGSNVTQFSACTAACEYPSWSPDGAWIAYPSGVASGPHTVIIQSVAEGRTLGLVANATDTGRPRWSPAGTELAYVGRDAAGQVDVYVIGGGQVRRITNSAAQEQFPSWAQ
jgi:Tol biopolymer transport system component